MKPEDYAAAKEIETLCGLLILQEEDVVSMRHASSREDMYMHYDLVAKLKDDRELKVDVKGLKSLGHGRAKTGEYHWIELKNASGAPGWLYGQADVFSFQVSAYDFVHVTKKRLAAAVNNILTNDIQDKTPVRTDPTDFAERYVRKRIFTRNNPNLPANQRRLDETILVETELLKIIATNPFKL